MSERPSAEAFTRHLNTPFTFQTSAGPIEMTLIEATEHPRGRRPEHLPTPMSLIFAGTPGQYLAQGNYAISHPELGSWEWFVVPIVSSDTRPQCQIVFN